MSSTYFDLQVNGYAGVDFNADDVGAADVVRACERLAADGVGGILATIITSPLPAMERRLRRLAEIRREHAAVSAMIRGFHVEGPFLSPVPGYRGAHDPEAIVPASLDGAQRLHAACGGLLKLFTLAPECDAGLRVTRWLTEQGVAVAAGHTDAPLATLRAAADAGLRLFTHTGNGCPLQMHRHDNIVQRALSLHDRLWLCFIADGVHVPFFALGNFLRACGLERAVVVTDAMQAAGMGPGVYGIGKFQVLVGEDLAAWAPDRSHLVGSAGTMAKTAANLREHLGLSTTEVRLLTAGNPRRALGLAD
ncbi:MAG: N-acetylglucosamine-6-phosphate deacetylase [Kiritimatiellae bacterium]|nr:N-acetylglucosamine-6-phosphate deacetylase [Kiritimatiellia bacterium]